MNVCLLKRSLCMGVLGMVVMGLGSGCKTKGFVYPVNAGQLYSEPAILLDRTLYVKQVSDQRPPARNSLKRTNFAMIPVIPFGMGSIEHPERKWRRAFSPQFSKLEQEQEQVEQSDSQLDPYYDAPHRQRYVPVRFTLTKAVLFSAEKSQLFSRVEPAPKDIPANSLVLECRLLSTKYTMSKITYGVSFLAIVPWYLIAFPKGTAGNQLGMEMALSNAGQEVWRYQFDKYSRRVFGGYYNRGNLFIGYPQNMQQGMNEALADLAAAMRREPEKFR